MNWTNSNMALNLASFGRWTLRDKAVTSRSIVGFPVKQFRRLG